MGMFRESRRANSWAEEASDANRAAENTEEEEGYEKRIEREATERCFLFVYANGCFAEERSKELQSKGEGIQGLLRPQPRF